MLQFLLFFDSHIFLVIYESSVTHNRNCLETGNKGSLLFCAIKSSCGGKLQPYSDFAGVILNYYFDASSGVVISNSECAVSFKKRKRILCGANVQVLCKPGYIKVKIPESIVEKYESGISDSEIYLSPSAKNIYSCNGVYNPYEKVYILTILSPFSGCGTQKTESGNYTEFVNTVWLNCVSPVMEMPLPILQFKCVYVDSEEVISTPLKPALKDAPLITNTGQFLVTMKAYMHPPGVTEDRELITSGSVCSMGETAYLTITVEPVQSNVVPPPLVLKLENCFASSAPQSKINHVDMVTDGCPNTQIGVQLLPLNQKLSSTISFITFQVSNSQIVYYSCEVDICSANDIACNELKICPLNRRKRSVIEPKKNMVHVGPIIILSDEEMAEYNQKKRGRPVVLSEKITEKNEDANEQMPAESTTNFIVIFLSSFTFCVLLTSLALCILIQRKDKVFATVH